MQLIQRIFPEISFSSKVSSSKFTEGTGMQGKENIIYQLKVNKATEHSQEVSTNFNVHCKVCFGQYKSINSHIPHTHHRQAIWYCHSTSTVLSRPSTTCSHLGIIVCL
jgi:hypothetical protein